MISILKVGSGGAILAAGVALFAGPAHAGAGAYFRVCAVPADGSYVLRVNGRTSGGAGFEGTPVTGFTMGASPTNGNKQHGQIIRFDGGGSYKTGQAGEVCKDVGYFESRSNGSVLLVYADIVFGKGVGSQARTVHFTGEVGVDISSGMNFTAMNHGNGAMIYPGKYNAKEFMKHSTICYWPDHCKANVAQWKPGNQPTLNLYIWQ